MLARFETEAADVLRLWGLAWTRNQACCHFFITRATGTGKTARDVITHAMHALALADLPVTLANVHDTICISTETAMLLAKLAEHPSPAPDVERQYFKDFADQPPEQKSGTVYTVANYLRPYTPPDIREVACSDLYRWVCIGGRCGCCRSVRGAHVLQPGKKAHCRSSSKGGPSNRLWGGRIEDPVVRIVGARTLTSAEARRAGERPHRAALAASSGRRLPPGAPREIG